MFKKKQKPDSEMTPDEIIITSTQKKLELENELKKQRKLGNFYAFPEKANDLIAQIELEKTKIALARENKENELKKPPTAPQSVKIDNSKHTTFQANVGDINSNNPKGINGNSVLNGNKIANAPKKATAMPQTDKKMPKAKIIFFCMIGVIFLAGVIALTVHITNCVRDNQENSSSTYTAMNL